MVSRLSSLRNLKLLSKYDAVQVHHMQEMCIAVDKNDHILGEVSKINAHVLPGMSLHRAFSIFAFTPDKRLILQKRSATKITFPNLWTNTCCSHPLYNESEREGIVGVKRAAVRKLNHELNITNISKEDCLPLGRFLYHAKMADSSWGEHELDYAIVIKNISLDRIKPNPEEVSDVCSVTEKELMNWVRQSPKEFSPWFTLFVQQSYLASWWKNLDNLEASRNTDIVQLN